jgi:hypothetical protein
MTYLNAICWPASTYVTRVSHDRSVAAILFLLLALVFAPVVGLHVALVMAGSNSVPPSAIENGDLARHATALRG